jgi:rod shape-determining protein MreD
MIKKNNFILMILVFALIEASVLYYLPFPGAKPDLFLICVVLASINFQPEYALSMSLLCGGLKDIFSAAPFGVNTFLLPVLSFMLIRLSRKVALDSTPVLCAAVFVVTVFYDIISRAALGFLGASIPFWIFLRIMFLSALYTSLVFPPVFKLFKKAVYS